MSAIDVSCGYWLAASSAPGRVGCSPIPAETLEVIQPHVPGRRTRMEPHHRDGKAEWIASGAEGTRRTLRGLCPPPNRIPDGQV